MSNERLKEAMGAAPAAAPGQLPPERPDPPAEGTPQEGAQTARQADKERGAVSTLVRSFGTFLEARRGNLQQLLPKHMDPGRLIRIAVTEFANNEKLRACTSLSIYSSILQAAATGLEIGVSGQSYLVPYRNKRTNQYECKWIPGYRGLILLARRTGELGDIRAELVYQGDRFEIQLGMPNRGFIHVPNLNPAEGKRGPIWLVYGVAEFTSGGYHFEYMLKSEVDAIRAYSQAHGDSSPWQTNYPEMARKSIFKRMSKWLPTSIELQTALQLDNLAAQGRRADVIEGVVVPVDPAEPEVAPGIERPPELADYDDSTV